jgi:hypothetical protein
LKKHTLSERLRYIFHLVYTELGFPQASYVVGDSADAFVDQHKNGEQDIVYTLCVCHDVFCAKLLQERIAYQEDVNDQSEGKTLTEWGQLWMNVAVIGYEVERSWLAHETLSDNCFFDSIFPGGPSESTYTSHKKEPGTKGVSLLDYATLLRFLAHPQNIEAFFETWYHALPRTFHQYMEHTGSYPTPSEEHADITQYRSLTGATFYQILTSIVNGFKAQLSHFLYRDNLKVLMEQKTFTSSTLGDLGVLVSLDQDTHYSLEFMTHIFEAELQIPRISPVFQCTPFEGVIDWIRFLNCFPLKNLQAEKKSTGTSLSNPQKPNHQYPVYMYHRRRTDPPADPENRTDDFWQQCCRNTQSSEHTGSFQEKRSLSPVVKDLNSYTEAVRRLMHWHLTSAIHIRYFQGFCEWVPLLEPFIAGFGAAPVFQQRAIWAAHTLQHSLYARQRRTAGGVRGYDTCRGHRQRKYPLHFPHENKDERDDDEQNEDFCREDSANTDQFDDLQMSLISFPSPLACYGISTTLSSSSSSDDDYKNANTDQKTTDSSRCKEKKSSPKRKSSFARGDFSSTHNDDQNYGQQENQDSPASSSSDTTTPPSSFCYGESDTDSNDWISPSYSANKGLGQDYPLLVTWKSFPHVLRLMQRRAPTSVPQKYISPSTEIRAQDNTPKDSSNPKCVGVGDADLLHQPSFHCGEKITGSSFIADVELLLQLYNSVKTVTDVFRYVAACTLQNWWPGEKNQNGAVIANPGDDQLHLLVDNTHQLFDMMHTIERDQDPILRMVMVRQDNDEWDPYAEKILDYEAEHMSSHKYDSGQHEQQQNNKDIWKWKFPCTACQYPLEHRNVWATIACLQYIRTHRMPNLYGGNTPDSTCSSFPRYSTKNYPYCSPQKKGMTGLRGRDFSPSPVGMKGSILETKSRGGNDDDNDNITNLETQSSNEYPRLQHGWIACDRDVRTRLMSSMTSYSLFTHEHALFDEPRKREHKKNYRRRLQPSYGRQNTSRTSRHTSSSSRTGRRSSSSLRQK